MQEKVLNWANGTQHKKDTVTWQIAEIAFNLPYWITVYQLNSFRGEESSRDLASWAVGQNLITIWNKDKLFFFPINNDI